MGVLLIVVGIAWALLGAGNIFAMLNGLAETNAEPGGVESIGFVVNVLLFVLPGLVLAGIGEFLRRRNPAESGPRMPCPSCGESIPRAAPRCRFCSADVSTLV